MLLKIKDLSQQIGRKMHGKGGGGLLDPNAVLGHAETIVQELENVAQWKLSSKCRSSICSKIGDLV